MDSATARGIALWVALLGITIFASTLVYMAFRADTTFGVMVLGAALYGAGALVVAAIGESA